MMFYLLLFVLLLLAELLYFRIADKFNIIDKPNQRSSHTRITLRGGGIVFYLGSVAYFISCGFPYGWFLLGLTLIAGISFADVFYQWGLLTAYPWWYILIAWIVCTGIINAYNFMDGINGITGGYSLAVLSALAYINHFVVPFIEQEYLLIHILAVLVFCIFNFRTKAKCFAGDVGSVSIAFVILFALGKLILVTGDLTYIILLAVYGVDSVLTIVHRLMLHENIGQPHRKHLYQIMANELKVPHVVVSSLYMVVQAVLVVGFVLSGYHWWCLGISLILLSIVYVGFMKKFFYLHKT